MAFLESPGEIICREADDHPVSDLECLLQEQGVPFMEHVECTPDAHEVESFIKLGHPALLQLLVESHVVSDEGCPTGFNGEDNPRII
jgi:hypothetical protein